MGAGGLLGSVDPGEHDGEGQRLVAEVRRRPERCRPPQARQCGMLVPEHFPPKLLFLGNIVINVEVWTDSWQP